MQVFPELDTNRLKLRKIVLEDVPALVKYANNKEVAKNILNIPYPYHEPDAVFRIRYVHGLIYQICKRNYNPFILNLFQI